MILTNRYDYNQYSKTDQNHGGERDLHKSDEGIRVSNMLYKGKNKDNKIIFEAFGEIGFYRYMAS